MFQTSINDYTKVVSEKLPEYLASLPDPSRPISEYVASLPEDPSGFKGLPIEWFDVAAATSLIRHHKDSKSLYDVNSFLIELLTTMFRVAIYKLGWMDDERASDLAGYLAYDKPVKTFDYFLQMHDLCTCIRRFPYSIENQVWYSYLLPLLAYTKQSEFNTPNYVARYLVNTINRNSLRGDDGGHARLLSVDFLRCVSSLGPLLTMCEKDWRYKDMARGELYRNVLAEAATVQLGCMLRISSINDSFKQIAAEVVAYHYAEYSEISQRYMDKSRSKEYPG